MTQAKNRAPGWDSKAISEIAKRCYGNYTEMFEAHNWPERETNMMPKVQKRVKESYGGVENFVTEHENCK